MEKKMQARPAPWNGLHFTSQIEPNKMQNEIYMVMISNPSETSDSVMWVLDLFARFQTLLGRESGVLQDRPNLLPE